MSLMRAGHSSIREWFDGLKSPGAPLAETKRTSHVEVAGTVGRGMIEGGIVGGLLGVASAHMGGSLDVGPKKDIPLDGLVAGATAILAIAAKDSEVGTSAANVSKVATGIMAYRKGEAFAAAKKGNVPQVAAAKTAALTAAATAHGDPSDANDPAASSGGHFLGAEDPLIAYGAANFK